MNRPALHGLISKSFYHALEIALLDELREEPKTILIIGGCRQRDFARHIALLLPAADIYVIDPDPEMVALAKAEICCRFKFVEGSIESLPFEDNFFDLTLAHNLMEYVTDWDQAMAQIGRTTQKNLLLSVHRPLASKFVEGMPGMAEALAADGISLSNVAKVDKNSLLRQLNRYGKIKLQLSPFPWKMMLVAMRPLREERLILSNDTENMAMPA